MKSYIFKRLLLSIPILLGITIITFGIIHITPGGPTVIQSQMNVKVSPDSIERLKALYDLDKPIHIQYIKWVKRLVFFNFGNSFIDERPVISKIVERLPATLLLNILSLFLIFIVAIPIGVFSATKQHSIWDKLFTVITFAGYSIPTFWLALILMLFFGIMLNWLPISGIHSINYDSMTIIEKIIDIAKHLILPVFISAFGGFASISRYTRSSMLEVIRQDYIRTARAKGLPEKVVIYKHALKNALLPIITILGLCLPGLIGGGIIFETIFAWPGMGRLAYESALTFDYPVIMGVVTIGAILTLIGNLLADITYALVDPRIRYTK
ncbi:MAG: ABC transporter permease [Candidatus Firestonebacteria bacterium]